MKSGVRDYILKSPKHFKTLCAVVRRIVERAGAQRAN
jgi:hypothetical protein